MPGDLRGDPADPANVGLPVLLGEGEPGREVAAHHVAVEAGHGALAALQQQVVQGAGEGRLARAGEPGEEHHEPLGSGLRGVEVDGLGDPLRQLALTGDAEHARGGVGPDHLLTQRLVVGRRGGATGRERGDDHGCGCAAGREPVGSDAGRADQSDGREALRGAVAGQRQQHHTGPGRLLADRGEVVVGQGCGHGHRQAVGVALAGLGRGQVEAAEGAELGSCQRRHRAVDAGGDAVDVVRRLRGHPGQGEALGIDQLQGARGLCRSGHGRRDDEPHQTVLALEAVQGCEGAGADQLEVVELSGRRAVLRHGGLVWHRHIVAEGSGVPVH